MESQSSSSLRRAILSAIVVPVVASLLGVAAQRVQPALAAALVVNSTLSTPDATPGNGVCDDGAGNCTLLAAIQEANALAGADTIGFNVPGAGVHSFAPPHLDITGPVTIDGLTQPGASCASWPPNLNIEISGALAPTVAAASIGLNIAASNVTVRGLVINKYQGVGINNVVGNGRYECNFIGTDATGSSDQVSVNADGIYLGNGDVMGGALPSQRNLVSGNNVGVGMGFNNTVQGNYIGTDVNGTAAIPNRYGVYADTVGQLQIGGGLAGQGNLVSGNSSYGIFVTSADNIAIQGNRIGTNASGTAALSNTFYGIHVDGSQHLQLGGGTGAGNLISGNLIGAEIIGTDHTVIQGNRVGTDASGLLSIPNNSGIAFTGNDLKFGGANAGEGNLIGGFGNEVQIGDGSATINGVVIQGNLFGLDATGQNSFGGGNVGLFINGIPNGPSEYLVSNVLIGGTTPSERNVLNGIGIQGARFITITGNYIGTNIGGSATLSPTFGLSMNAVDHSSIGGSNAGEGNLISGSMFNGILMNDSFTSTIQGNLIGTDVTGATILGNEQDGIQIVAGGNILVGGSATGMGNTIAGNNRGVVIINPFSFDTLQGNVIRNNTLIGVDVVGPPNNAYLLSNRIFGQPLPTVGLPPAASFVAAVPDGSGNVNLRGWYQGSPNTAYTVEVFAASQCNPQLTGTFADLSYMGNAENILGSLSLTSDVTGTVLISNVLPMALAGQQWLAATVTGPNGSTNLSKCMPVQPNNVNWVDALDVTAPQPIDQFLTLPGETRWYKVKVQPSGKASLNLSNLPEAYDLAAFDDISQTVQRTNTSTLGMATQAAALNYDAIETSNFVTNTLDPQTLVPEAYTAQALSPSEFNPTVVSKVAVSPFQYSPFQYSPFQYSPFQYSPFQYSPFQYSPFQYSPFQYSPFQYSPFQYSPFQYSPFQYSPFQYSPIYNSAIPQSLLAATNLSTTASRTVSVNTWNNNGYFYFSVTGRNGSYSPAQSYTAQSTVSSACNLPQAQVDAIDTQTALNASAGDFRTIILMDMARISGSATEKAALSTLLNSFKTRADVQGVVVDVGADGRVAAANALADANLGCPYAKNLVAERIKAIVDRYQVLNPNLAYVTLVGGDNVIPFFRYPDQSMLGNESTFKPPVQENSASQASLRLSYVLGQDGYGSSVDIPFKTVELPVPQLAVGRLAETASDATSLLNAYIAVDGVVTPASSLVTGYDFHYDSASAMKTELQSSLGNMPDSLLSPSTQSNQLPGTWTANDLRAKLLQNRYDMVYLGGHFSDGSAEAADYKTTITAAELLTSSVDMRNMIAFSPGCHSAYNTVDSDSIVGVTQFPDWAQAFAQKGVTWIGGTGYQYGDSDFSLFGERLYYNFARILRIGSAPVAVGDAFKISKQQYLLDSSTLRGLDMKTLQVATLYGLPMLRVNMPNKLLIAPADLTVLATPPSIVTALNNMPTNPGATLSLKYADVSIAPTLAQRTVSLADVNNPTDVTVATYVSGTNGVVANPAEPVLPLEMRNVAAPSSAPAGTLLRGVGFRGGNYTQQGNIFPLTGAPATELRGVHLGFSSDTLYPVRPWTVNYFDQIIKDATGNGATMLALTPAQFQSTATGSTIGMLRTFNNMQFRLYYSNDVNLYGANLPAYSDAPSIVAISSTISGSTALFTATVTGDPAAGIQEVWVTFTGIGAYAGVWQSLNLTQNMSDTTLWTGSLNLASPSLANGFSFMVQAANGAGKVALDTNVGAFYHLNEDTGIAYTSPAGSISTTVALQSPPTNGVYGSQASVNARLTSSVGNAPISNVTLSFQLGSLVRTANTDGNGVASLSLPLLVATGSYNLTVSYFGAANLLASSTSAPFTILKQNTNLSLGPTSANVNAGNDAVFTATLTDAGNRPLVDETVVFIISDGGSTQVSRSVRTNQAGQAVLQSLISTLGAGDYTVAAYYGGAIPAPVNATIVLDVYNPATPAQASLSIAAGITVTPSNTATPTPTNTATNTPTPTPTNTATNTPTPTPTNTATNTPTTAPANVDLWLDMSDGGIAIDPAASSGSRIVLYTLAYANLGTSSATNVKITETVPLNTNFVAANSWIGWSCADNSPAQSMCVFNIGTLSAGARGSIVFAVRQNGSTSPISIVNVARIGGAQVEANLANNAATVTTPLIKSGGSNVAPVLECVIDKGVSANPRYAAVFGYNNPNAFAKSIAIGGGNTFSPTPADRGQGTVYLPGRQRNTFAVPFNSGNLAWTLNGSSASASTSSPRCASSYAIVSGTVWYDSNGNSLRDASELGIPLVVVRLVDGNGVAQRTRYTSVSGSYTLIADNSAGQTVQVFAPPTLRFVTKFVNGGSNSSTNSAINQSSWQTDALNTLDASKPMNAGVR